LQERLRNDSEILDLGGHLELTPHAPPPQTDFDLETIVEKCRDLRAMYDENGNQLEVDDYHPIPTETKLGTSLRRGFLDGAPDKSSLETAAETKADTSTDGMTAVQIGGATYRMNANGIIFDPPGDVPIGCWKADARRVDPVLSTLPNFSHVVVSYFGRSYVLLPKNQLLDPSTQCVVGSLNPESGANLLEDAVSPLEYQDKAHRYFEEERFRAAAYFYGEALKACAKQGVDRDFECHLLRSRAVCFRNLDMQDLFLQDVERVLILKPGDQQAKEWKDEPRDRLWRVGYWISHMRQKAQHMRLAMNGLERVV